MIDGEHRPALNGVRQWVRVAGVVHDTVPLVLLHGGPGGNHYNFERSAGPLLEQFRTVVYHEQRGSGRSDAPPQATDYSLPLLVADLNALQDWLGVPQVDLLGYSFGGGLALEYAAAHPERVRRLVLQAPALRFHDPQIIASQLAGFSQVAQGKVLKDVQSILNSNQSPAQQLEAVWAIVDASTVDRFLFQNAEVAAQNRRWWQEGALSNSGDMQRALNAQPPTGTAEKLYTIHSPTLILAGRHDRNVPLDMLQGTANTIPNARILVFEHSAHFPDMEETQAYAKAVLDFLH